MGIVVTSPGMLEKLARVSKVVFDKTGTLTHGRYDLVRAQAMGTHSVTEGLNLAGALEVHSEHPIGKSLVAARTDDTLHANDIENSPARGCAGPSTAKDGV
jgi:Cu2+-exporting ATPase